MKMITYQRKSLMAVIRAKLKMKKNLNSKLSG
jgi:hypothetical protein